MFLISFFSSIVTIHSVAAPILNVSVIIIHLDCLEADVAACFSTGTGGRVSCPGQNIDWSSKHGGSFRGLVKQIFVPIQVMFIYLFFYFLLLRGESENEEKYRQDNKVNNAFPNLILKVLQFSFILFFTIRHKDVRIQDKSIFEATLSFSTYNFSFKMSSYLAS